MVDPPTGFSDCYPGSNIDGKQLSFHRQSMFEKSDRAHIMLQPTADWVPNARGSPAGPSSFDEWLGSPLNYQFLSRDCLIPLCWSVWLRPMSQLTVQSKAIAFHRSLALCRVTIMPPRQWLVSRRVPAWVPTPSKGAHEKNLRCRLCRERYAEALQFCKRNYLSETCR